MVRVQHRDNSEKQKHEIRTEILSTYIEMIKLWFCRHLVHKLEHIAKVAHVDTTLMEGLSQRGPIHWQGCVV